MANVKSALIEALAVGAPITLPIAIVVAHPDDETIGMGGRLARLENLTLIHVTDGAPADGVRARKLGFATNEDYSRARFGELDKALTTLGATPTRRTFLGFPDGQIVFRLSDLVESIETAIAGAAAVVTHAYEGGHPDHDACAFAVQFACTRIAAAGSLPPHRLEFAGYHRRNGQLMVNCFCSDAESLDSSVRLSWRERRTKRKAMQAFVTQKFILEDFPAEREAYRVAPEYDFLKPPPPGEWNYDRSDWPLKGRQWLAQVRSAIAQQPSDRGSGGA